ncbi:MAG: hypothetical protein M1815_004795 [Lichina confinis]|nr:MAG: hypothetical protein M1815_004795 [Lichina confinis]
MTVTPFGSKKQQSDSSRPPPPLHTASDFSQTNIVAGGGVAGVQNPTVIYQHIQDLSAKRISTLDYLRKAQEGHIFWFNTILFNKQDLSRLPSFDPKKLSRRATNYLLLGLSLPMLSDITSHNPLDYLRSLNSLLTEFDAYQQVHPSDGSTSSSLSRARIPHMFRRATHVSTGKGRRASSATEIGLPLNSGAPAGGDMSDVRSIAGNSSISSTGTTMTSTTIAASLPANDPELDDYTYLSTPFLPFDPDFHETFATVCDVLIDCYTRVINVASSPVVCTPAVADMFSKVDGKIRKIVIGGIIKDFEDTSRSSIRAEVNGVGKVVFGGLR